MSDCILCSSPSVCDDCSGSKYAYGSTCWVNCPATTYGSGDVCLGKTYFKVIERLNRMFKFGSIL